MVKKAFPTLLILSLVHLEFGDTEEHLILNFRYCLSLGLGYSSWMIRSSDSFSQTAAHVVPTPTPATEYNHASESGEAAAGI